MTTARHGLARLVCELARKNDPLSGVRPCGWTESSRDFDRLAGVLILELGWAEIA
jgi:hypothetical protein